MVNIILFSLWFYPVISFILMWLMKKKPLFRKRLFFTSLTLTSLTLLGIWTNISTTSSTLDWLLFSNIYFTVTFGLLWILFESSKLLKIISFLIIGGIYKTVYSGFSLAILFILGDYTPVAEKWLDSGLIYKETLLGNAISHDRGKRVEIYQTISWLPIIEWRKQQRVYINFSLYLNPFVVDYKPSERKIYLSTIGGNWRDTLNLDNINCH